MKKLLLCLTLVGLLVLALGGTAGAMPPTLKSHATTVAGTNPSMLRPVWAALVDQTSPSVSAIDPASAPNDIDTPVTITGAGFAASPTASLGSTALTNVTWVSATTLTATVPWGLNPSVYPLTVVNPDGGSVTLPNAYTVTPGIGQWNGGSLFGGDVHQILMKPGDPKTLYAPANGLRGLFRSTDAGASWQYTGGDFSLAGKLAVDAQHPDWLWAYEVNGMGVVCSKDEGDTWTTVLATWPDGRPIANGQVYPSPSDPQALFVSSHYDPIEGGPAGAAQGLIRSPNGGASWTIVPGLEGVSVEDVAFDPSDSSQMVLVTGDALVYHSNDAGGTWSPVASPPRSSIGFNEALAYNPYVPGEVWIVSDNAPDGVFKSTSAALSGWQDVTPATLGGASITFTGADSVYVTWHHSTDGGAHWDGFGPVTGVYTLIFDPTNAQVGYVGDRTYGVQKTTDGGQTWQIANQGLAGMMCSSLDVARSDPLRVFATFGFWPGVYRSEDGAGTWGYVQVPGSYPIMHVVCTDPTDANRVYALSPDSVYRSTDGGDTWADLGWSVSTSLPQGGLEAMAPDPFVSGHLLVAFDSGENNFAGYVYASSDYGASWQAVTMPQGVGRITDIAFDPQTPGLVYLAVGGMGAVHGTGVYRSTDGGASWTRIDDPAQPDMRDAQTIAIATHPQHMLIVPTFGNAYRSTDGGATWHETQGGHGNYLFAGADSTRLYASDPTGLCFSSDAGDTWTRAAGAFGQLQILALGYADANGHTILYAATNGGVAGATSSMAATSRRAATTASTLVDAGIYRYVLLLAPKLTSFTPTSGPVGTTVTLTGTHFTGATKVAVHGASAVFSVNSATKITATVPSGATTGTIAVTTPGGSATSTASFTVIFKPKVTLRLRGLTSGALKLGRRVTAKGKATPTSLAGSYVKLKVQKKKSGRWVTVKTKSRLISATGTYSWKYKPLKKGSYRMRAQVAKTARHTAAKTVWRSFKVK